MNSRCVDYCVTDGCAVPSALCSAVVKVTPWRARCAENCHSQQTKSCTCEPPDATKACHGGESGRAFVSSLAIEILRSLDKHIVATMDLCILICRRWENMRLEIWIING